VRADVASCRELAADQQTLTMFSSCFTRAAADNPGLDGLYLLFATTDACGHMGTSPMDMSSQAESARKRAMNPRRSDRHRWRLSPASRSSLAPRSRAGAIALALARRSPGHPKLVEDAGGGITVQPTWPTRRLRSLVEATMAPSAVDILVNNAGIAPPCRHPGNPNNFDPSSTST